MSLIKSSIIIPIYWPKQNYFGIAVSGVVESSSEGRLYEPQKVDISVENNKVFSVVKNL